MTTPIPTESQDALDLEKLSGGRRVVHEWLDFFDPPPQIDFQQSEALQALIDSTIAEQRAEIERLTASDLTGSETISALRERIAALEAGLKPFGIAADHLNVWAMYPDDTPIWATDRGREVHIRAGDLRAARSLLQPGAPA